MFWGGDRHYWNYFKDRIITSRNGDEFLEC